MHFSMESKSFNEYEFSQQLCRELFGTDTNFFGPEPYCKFIDVENNILVKFDAKEISFKFEQNEEISFVNS
jgi:hypothetical protein